MHLEWLSDPRQPANDHQPAIRSNSLATVFLRCNTRPGTTAHDGNGHRATKIE